MTLLEMTRRFKLLLAFATTAAASLALAPPVAADECGEEVALSVVATAATDIVDREPVGTSGPFHANGEHVHIHLRVDNSAGPEQELTVVWLHGDFEHAQTIEVGVSSRWRTAVRQRMRASSVGQWRVQVLHGSGCVLAELELEVVPESGG